MEAIAAGTLAIIDITAFKFISMKIYKSLIIRAKTRSGQPTVASMLDMNLFKVYIMSVSTLSSNISAYTHAIMKKINPSPKISVTSLERLLDGNASFQPVRQRTTKSNAMV